MSDIQKVLPTDTFKDMVIKINAVIDEITALRQTVTNLYKDIQSSDDTVSEEND